MILHGVCSWAYVTCELTKEITDCTVGLGSFLGGTLLTLSNHCWQVLHEFFKAARFLLSLPAVSVYPRADHCL
jgi:hypothetical protein